MMSTEDDDGQTGSTEPPPEDWVLMEVGGVTVDPESQVPVVVLRAAEDPSWFLPIFVGGTEATAIAASVAGVELPRPVTHDLFASVIALAGVTLEVALIVGIDDGTFLAKAVFHVAGDSVASLDARPSDAVAMALRCAAPILVSREVMVEAGGFAPEAIEDGEAGPDEDDEEVPTASKRGGGPAAADAGQGAAGQPVPLLSPDVRIEDLDPRLFGKYKM